MTIKLIALDADGTLLNSKGELSQANIEAVGKALAAGIKVTLVTGRMFASAGPIAQKLGITLPIVTYQGAYLRAYPDGEVLLTQNIGCDLAAKLVKRLQALGVSAQVYLDDTLCAEADNASSVEYARLCKVPLKTVDGLASWLLKEPQRAKGVHKVLAVGEVALLDDIWHQWEVEYADNLYITKSHPQYLEFISARADKGRALSFLADHLGIAQEEIMACGDSYNDMRFLAAAGLKVAMGNAVDAVKQMADYVAPTNNEDGVARAIERFVLKGEA